MKTIYTPGEVAEMMMVSPITIRSWANQGELNAVTTAGGHRRFLREDIMKFAEERNIHLQLNLSTGIRILIVDDSESLAKYLYESLSTQPQISAIEVANNGFLAGSLVYTFNPQIILLDLMMPGVDGFTVCRQIKEQETTKKIRVIAMTGFYSDENIKKITDAGAECCLKKPFKQKDLLEALALDKKKYANEVL